MVGSSLLDTVLAREQREEELNAERDDDFQTWVRRLNTESKMLLKRINEFDFSEGSDRSEYYELIGKIQPRFEELRERHEIGEVPVPVVMKLDELLGAFEVESRSISIRSTLIGPSSPARQARKKQREKEREQKKERWATEHADELTEKLGAVYDAIPDDK